MPILSREPLTTCAYWGFATGATSNKLSIKSFGKNKTVNKLHKRVRALQRQEQAEDIENQTHELAQMAMSTVAVRSEFDDDIMSTIPVCSIFTFNDTQNFSIPTSTQICPLHLVSTTAQIDLDNQNETNVMSYQTSTADARRLSMSLFELDENSAIVMHITTR